MQIVLTNAAQAAVYAEQARALIDKINDAIAGGGAARIELTWEEWRAVCHSDYRKEFRMREPIHLIGRSILGGKYGQAGVTVMVTH